MNQQFLISLEEETVVLGFFHNDCELHRKFILDWDADLWCQIEKWITLGLT